MAAVTLFGSAWTMDPESVPLPGSDIGQIAMPAEARNLREVEARFGSMVIE